MSDGRVVELRDVDTLVGDTRPVDGLCRCRRGSLPLHVVERTAGPLRELIAAGLAARPELAGAVAGDLLTFRCRDCKAVAIISVEGAGLA